MNSRMMTILLLGGALGFQALPLGAAPQQAETTSVQPAAQGAEYQALLEQLGRLGDRLTQATKPSEMALYSMQQADVMAQIAARVSIEERPVWLKRMADTLNMAALNSSPQD